MESKKLRYIIAKLLDCSVEEIYNRFQRAKSIPDAEKPTKDEILDFYIDLDLERETKNGSIPATQNSPMVQNSKIGPSPKEPQKPLRTVTNEIECPVCHAKSKYSEPTGKRPRKLCSKCGVKSEFKKWILDPKMDPISIPRKSPKTHQILPKPNQDILDSEILLAIGGGLYLSNIAKTLHCSISKIYTRIKKLEDAKKIVALTGYPRFYKILGEQKPVESWPTQSSIHCLRFRTDLKQIGDLTKTQPKPMENWTKHIFYPADHAGLDKKWTIEINTRCVIFNYRYNVVNSRNIQNSIENIKQQIPYAFLESKGFILTKSTTRQAQKEHCVVKLPTDKLGINQNLTIQKNDESVWIDDSSGFGTGETETHAENAQSIIDVPKQIQNLSQQMNQMSTAIVGISNLLQQFVTMMQTGMQQQIQPLSKLAPTEPYI